MNWEEKIVYVKENLDQYEDIEDDFYVQKNGMSIESIDSLRETYPYITHDYIRFIKLTDGADIAQCRFYGSSEYGGVAQIYSDIYMTSEWFAFGHTAGGDPLLMNKSGMVALGYAKKTSGDFHILADSFADFMGDVLMGKQFPLIYQVEESELSEFLAEEREDDPWVAFLIEMNWV